MKYCFISGRKTITVRAFSAVAAVDKFCRKYPGETYINVTPEGKEWIVSHKDETFHLMVPKNKEGFNLHVWMAKRRLKRVCANRFVMEKEMKEGGF